MTELVLLLRRTPSCDDLERAATLLGAAFDPDTDAGTALGTVGPWLESMAASSPADFADLLATVLGRHELRGDREDYFDPANSMLHRIAAGGQGIPISLSVVVACAGKRAGVDVELVGLPGHVMIRSEDQWADPFSGPAVLSPVEALRRWTAHSGRHPAMLETPDLRAMTNRAVIVRMLNNLTAEFVRRDNRFAMDVAVRLRQEFAELASEGPRWAVWQAAWN